MITPFLFAIFAFVVGVLAGSMAARG